VVVATIKMQQQRRKEEDEQGRAESFRREKQSIQRRYLDIYDDTFNLLSLEVCCKEEEYDFESMADNQESYFTCVRISETAVLHKCFPVVFGTKHDLILRDIQTAPATTTPCPPSTATTTTTTTTTTTSAEKCNDDVDDPLRHVYGCIYISGRYYFVPFFLVNTNIPHYFKRANKPAECRFLLYNTDLQSSMIRYTSNHTLHIRTKDAINIDILNERDFEANVACHLRECCPFDPDVLYAKVDGIVDFLHALLYDHPAIDDVANKRFVSGAFLFYETINRAKVLFLSKRHRRNNSSIGGCGGSSSSGSGSTAIIDLQSLERKLISIFRRGDLSFIVSKATSFFDSRKNTQQHNFFASSSSSSSSFSNTYAKTNMYKPVELSNIEFLPYMLMSIKILTSRNVKGYNLLFSDDYYGFVCPTGVGEMGNVGRIGLLATNVSVTTIQKQQQQQRQQQRDGLLNVILESIKDVVCRRPSQQQQQQGRGLEKSQILQQQQPFSSSDRSPPQHGGGVYRVHVNGFPTIYRTDDIRAIFTRLKLYYPLCEVYPIGPTIQVNVLPNIVMKKVRLRRQSLLSYNDLRYSENDDDDDYMFLSPRELRYFGFRLQFTDARDILSDAGRLVSLNHLNTPLSKKIVTVNNLKNSCSSFEYSEILNYVRGYSQVLVDKPDGQPFLNLYTAFGDIQGNTTEDAYIINSNVKIAIRFIKQYYVHATTASTTTTTTTNSTTNSGRQTTTSSSSSCIDFLERMTLLGEYVLHVGVLVSNDRLTFNNYNKLNVTEKKVGSLYYYQLLFVSNFNLITNRVDMTVRYSVQRRRAAASAAAAVVVNLRLRIVRHDYIGVGTKICSLFGNKGVISAACDMSHIVDSKTRTIQPDILAPICALVGRQSTGQMKEIDTHDCLEIVNTQNDGETGRMGRCVTMVECINSYDMLKWSTNSDSTHSLKFDLMTNINGFLLNGISESSCALLSQNAGVGLFPNLEHEYLLSLYRCFDVSLDFKKPFFRIVGQTNNNKKKKIMKKDNNKRLTRGRINRKMVEK
jgi:hypothetical protein